MSVPEPQIKKLNTLSFLQLWNLKKRKCLHFFIWGSGDEIWSFSLHFSSLAKWCWKIRKWPYLGPWASNQKNKGTFLSLTFKVGEKKVPLVFWFEAHRLIYGHFLLSTIVRWLNDIGKWENGHISAPEPQIKKLKALSFLQLWKLKKGKCLFFIWRSGAEI